MNKLDHFDIIEDYAVARPEGPVRLEQAVQLATQAITRAREARIKKLLINATGLTGFSSPPSPNAISSPANGPARGRVLFES